MIIRNIEELKGSEREVSSDNWISRRLLLKKDGMGFSMHETVIRKGTETEMWYRHHLEAVYCTQGEGEIEDLETGNVHQIKPGVLYALDQHDRHILRASEEMKLVCVFNPPCTGAEKHNAEGAYEPDFHQETVG